MQFIDLTVQQQRIRDKIDQNIKSVLDHGKYIMGPEVKALEDQLSDYVKVKHAIACSSGTDALLLALMAYGTGPGDAIFTTPFTFIATAEVICLLGATPVFVDIDPRTFNIDPNKLEQTITALKNNDSTLSPLPINHNPSPLKPKGIITVDVFGLPCDYDKITEVADKNDLFVIEDAAQSFGAEYKGRKAGSLAEIACTSFFPAKPLGCYGDGGMCFTDNDNIAETMDSLRLHGKGSHKYDNVRIGINGRLDTLQAAILLAKFDIFPEEVDLRNAAAQRYAVLLSRLPLNEALLVPPTEPEGLRSAWAQYSMLAQDENHRTTIQANLNKEGIPTAIYYPKPLHLQTAFKSLGYKKRDFPNSEDCASRIFSLPMHPYLKAEDQKLIVDVLLKD